MRRTVAGARPRTGMKRWIGNLVVLIVTLLALEFALRQVLGGMEQAMLYDVWEPVPGSCMGLRPGAQVEYTGWFLKIPPVAQEVNSYGYRGPERPPAKPPGVFRVAALGDSYTYGMGVRVEDALPTQLERPLAGRGARTVEVLNFGVPGASLEDSVARLRQVAARWQPDLVLFFLYADDLEESLCHWAEPRSLLLGLLAWKSYLARTLVIFSRFAGLWRMAVTGESGAWPARLAEQMHALHQASQEAGARLAVVALGDPSAYRLSPRLAELLEREDVPWLDARPWLFGERAARLPIIPGEMHFTPEGNRLAAERVAAWLGDAGLVPTGDAS